MRNINFTLHSPYQGKIESAHLTTEYNMFCFRAKLSPVFNSVLQDHQPLVKKCPVKRTWKQIAYWNWAYHNKQ